MTETIQQRIARAVTRELIEEFRTNGAVRIRNIFSSDELAILRDAIDRNIAEPSPRAKVASRPDDPGWFFEDFCNWQDNAGYRRFIMETPAPAGARPVISRAARPLHDLY